VSGPVLRREDAASDIVRSSRLDQSHGCDVPESAAGTQIVRVRAFGLIGGIRVRVAG